MLQGVQDVDLPPFASAVGNHSVGQACISRVLTKLREGPRLRDASGPGGWRQGVAENVPPTEAALQGTFSPSTPVKQMSALSVTAVRVPLNLASFLPSYADDVGRCGERNRLSGPPGRASGLCEAPVGYGNT